MFKYKPRSYSEAEKRTTQTAFDRESFINEKVKMWKAPVGDSLIRILPPTWEDAVHFGYDVHLHYNVGAGRNTYLCNEAMHKGRCPICEQKNKALEEGNVELAKQLTAQRRVLVYMIDKSSPSDIKIWSMPWTVDKDIMIQAVDKHSHEILPLDDPESGYDISIIREGEKLLTRYTVAISRKMSKLRLSDDSWAFLEENAIPSVLLYYSYEHLKSILDTSYVAEKSSAKDSDDEDAPVKSAKPSKTEAEYDDDIPFEAPQSKEPVKPASLPVESPTEQSAPTEAPSYKDKLALLRQQRLNKA